MVWKMWKTPFFHLFFTHFSPFCRTVFPKQGRKPPSSTRILPLCTPLTHAGVNWTVDKSWENRDLSHSFSKGIFEAVQGFEALFHVFHSLYYYY